MPYGVAVRSTAMRTSMISIGCPGDPVLHRIGPLALAAAASVAIVIDLDSSAPPLSGELTLAELVVDGVRARHLSPPRSGVAVLPNGGVSRNDAADVIAALASSWPRVVLREADPVVQIVALIPGMPLTSPEGPAVYQPSGPLVRAPGPGVLLPRLTRSVALDLMRGAIPIRRRWVGAWAAVWEAKWA